MERKPYGSSSDSRTISERTKADRSAAARGLEPGQRIMFHKVGGHVIWQVVDDTQELARAVKATLAETSRRLAADKRQTGGR